MRAYRFPVPGDDHCLVYVHCSNAMEAGNFLRSKKEDLIFLDIQMPEITGLQFIGTLKNPPAIILTTAFRDLLPRRLIWM